ncbi:hypothetical protein C8A05DRAFT_34472 [Staphylotrichum tortipilum]|uniref:Uncharacterized protein n=1 Tax=Staphylotrichum tortipilum TaxID=2831512 RepID=A0AAN6MKD7_9PEZI|nr:hypothetical protein C8A05DRAFT_34472 [Staphylotrichum longicolle]
MANSNHLFHTGDPAFDAPVVLHDIKEWIEQQQLNPTPLTALQVRAIADLRRSFEPDLGQKDWVSMLNFLRQARGMPAPEYLDEPSTTDEGRWTCHCHYRPRFGADALVFPSAAAGYVPGPAADGTLVAPAFARKKDAKQYAAKCCYEALTSSATNAMAVAAAEGEAAGNINVAPAATVPAKKTVPTPAPTAQAKTAAPDKQALLDLARKLGLPPPQIVIVPSADPATSAIGSFFDAHVEFGGNGGGGGGGVEVPAGVGRVTGVYGRRNARDAVAEEVYEWLVEEERRRMGELEELLGGTVKREVE